MEPKLLNLENTAYRQDILGLLIDVEGMIHLATTSEATDAQAAEVPSSPATTSEATDAQAAEYQAVLLQYPY